MPFSFTGYRSKRTNFLSVGVTLCALVAAICVTPLAFVNPWIAIWLLSLATIVILGTFSIWAFHAVKNPRMFDTEEHVEQMAQISLLGSNREGGPADVQQITIEGAVANPQLTQGEQA